MEYKTTIQDANSKNIRCVQWNPSRREMYTGSEDGIIKTWDESGKLLYTMSDHIGWVTDLHFCKDLKVLFSSSVDGELIVWGPNGKLIQRISTDEAIYCLAYNSRRQQVLAGYQGKVRVFQVINADEVASSTTDVLEQRSVSSSEHTDIISCISSYEGRFYTAGYDRRIVIYDSPHVGAMKLRTIHVITNAHDAGISAMVFGKDADNQWLITGSFDRTVKLWSLDGNLLQKFDGFNDTITAICYVPPTQTLWISANSSTPVIYDPRSGINVSDFVTLDTDFLHNISGQFSFRHFLFVPETNELIGVTSRKSAVVWRYNPAAAITTLVGHTEVVESLTFTAKEPLLIFSAGGDGAIKKWERLQLNTFMYSQEMLALPKEEEKLESPRGFEGGTSESRKHLGMNAKRMSQKLEVWKRNLDEESNGIGKVHTLLNSTVRTFERKQKALEADRKWPSRSTRAEKSDITHLNRKSSVMRLVYYEELDYLVSAFESSKILVWGYNEDSVKYSPETTDHEIDSNFLLNKDSVTNRVAGLTCKYSLQDHKDAVTGLVCINQDGKHWLVSTGWDRRILIWNLETGLLHDFFRNSSSQYGKEELAADGIILDLEYSPETNCIAYASGDRCVYIRKFSPKGDEMTLQAVLQGHDAEVTGVRWNKKCNQWVTASEDRTIRIWPAEGIPCLRMISNDGPVTSLCIDQTNGSIITGSSDKAIRTFDPEKRDEMVQKNVGHKDEIRFVIHIPARDQYVSASWDNTVKIWNAYIKKGQRRQNVAMASAAGSNAVEEASSYTATISALMSTRQTISPVAHPLEKRSSTKGFSISLEQARLDEELKTTLGELESALTNVNIEKLYEGRTKIKVFSPKDSKDSKVAQQK